MQALRRTALAFAPKRSGGHPDFPNIASYRHKKTILPHDPMITVYDGVHPEPAFDSTLPYLTGTTLLKRFLSFWATVLGAGVVVSWYIINNSQSVYTASYNQNDANPRRAFFKEIMERKSYDRPSPLGHIRTLGNDGRQSKTTAWYAKFYKL
mmetsp:Transcript_378/g.447  ORF Transcript_378/g.447 Transcript_378/m.447 type:complete len:152 (+) Transcript_378:769-1224(+)